MLICCVIRQLTFFRIYPFLFRYFDRNFLAANGFIPGISSFKDLRKSIFQQNQEPFQENAMNNEVNVSKGFITFVSKNEADQNDVPTIDQETLDSLKINFPELYKNLVIGETGVERRSNKAQSNAAIFRMIDGILAQSNDFVLRSKLITMRNLLLKQNGESLCIYVIILTSLISFHYSSKWRNSDSSEDHWPNLYRGG